MGAAEKILSYDVELNWRKLKEKDAKAKEKGILVGRYITEPYKGNYAIYEIIDVYKDSVCIQAVTGLGKDLIIPQWGKKATIDKYYVLQSIIIRDRLDELSLKQQ